MNPKIEKGIPIPSTIKTTGPTALLRSLKVGDSFTSTKRSGWHDYAMNAGITITTRKIGSQQFRIWRTA